MSLTIRGSSVDIAQWQPLTSQLRMVSNWRRRACERAQLARMSEAELKDIGLTHADVWAEVQKPCWRR
jgi:uncharacterized protein YjiS (DUF1127 family)